MNVILESPFGTPTAYIELPSPELGDIQAIDLNTKFKRSMGGSMYSFIGEVTFRRSMVFIGCAYNKMLTAKAFYKAALPYDMKVTFHDGVIWKCRLEQGSFSGNESHRDVCNFSLTVVGTDV